MKYSPGMFLGETEKRFSFLLITVCEMWSRCSYISLPITGLNRAQSLESKEPEDSQGQALAGEEPLKEGRGDMAFLEVGIVEDAAVERDGGLDAFDDEFVEGAAHAGHAFLPVAAMGNQLRNHRVVVR